MTLLFTFIHLIINRFPPVSCNLYVLIMVESCVCNYYTSLLLPSFRTFHLLPKVVIMFLCILKRKSLNIK